MAVRKVGNSDIVTQLVLLSEQMQTYNKNIEMRVGDHESRIRRIEESINALTILIAKMDGKIDVEMGKVKERMTGFNLIQGTLTALASAFLWIFKK